MCGSNYIFKIMHAHHIICCSFGIPVCKSSTILYLRIVFTFALVSYLSIFLNVEENNCLQLNNVIQLIEWHKIINVVNHIELHNSSIHSKFDKHLSEIIAYNFPIHIYIKLFIYIFISSSFSQYIFTSVCCMLYQVRVYFPTQKMHTHGIALVESISIYFR